MRIRVLLLISAFFLLTPTIANAQIDDPEPVQDPTLEQDDFSRKCLSVDNLEQLIHMSLSDMVLFLEDRGYEMALSLSPEGKTRIDTINDIPLTYSVTNFNSKSNGNAVLTVFISQDGLSNYIRDVRSIEGDCSLDSSFRMHPNYREDRENNYFQGTKPVDGKLETYDVRCFPSNNMMLITICNNQERQKFVNKKRDELSIQMNDKLKLALAMADYNSYTEALKQIDEIDQRFMDSDTIVPNTRGRIVRKAEKYYFELIFKTANADNNLNGALAWCDTLMSITPNQDSVHQVIKVLRTRQSGTSQLYSTFHPESYKSVVSSITNVVNNEIRTNLVRDPQHIRINFTFHTEKKNLSNGKIELFPESKVSGQDKQGIRARQTLLTKKIDDIAASNEITPVKDHGITVITNETLTAHIKWYFFSESIVNEPPENKQDFKPFVEKVEDEFFTTRTTKLTVSGDTTIFRKQLPTKREYTFGVTHKTVTDGNDQNTSILYTDVTLTDFKSPGIMSWFPSLIVPGLGTSRQGDPHSTAARALPFYLFTGLSIAGFVYEFNHSGDIRYTLDDPDQHMPWEYRNFGYWLGGICGALAVTIYITDLTQAISNSINNVKRTKEIRSRLRKGPIPVQTQDVILWSVTD